MSVRGEGGEGKKGNRDKNRRARREVHSTLVHIHNTQACLYIHILYIVCIHVYACKRFYM